MQRNRIGMKILNYEMKDCEVGEWRMFEYRNILDWSTK